MENEKKLFRVKSLKDFVPGKLHFWIFIVFAVIFQFSEGIYLALTKEIVGSLALRSQDVMMAGYASFVGMTMVFPVLFAFKARFTTKTILLITSLGIVACDITLLTTAFVPVLVLAGFIGGILKLWGTFTCFSSIQLKITPKWDFAVFLPVVFLIVLGSIQLSGIIAGYITYFFRWEYMQLFMIGVMLLIALSAATIFRHHRDTPMQPLKNVDWLGAVLWSLFLMLVIFVFEYGEYYDWLYSGYIKAAVLCAFITLGIIIWRTGRIEHPYIHLKSFRFRHIDTLLVLFGLMCILLATPHILQTTYTGAILHYDSLNMISLNWSVLIGVIAGTYFSYVALVKFEWGYKALTNIGFALILVYLISFYFLISPVADKEMMYIPLFLSGAGNVIIYITLTVYAGRTVPFTHFFQVLAILGFVRTGFGSSLGTAIWGRAFSAVLNKNVMSLCAGIDSQNSILKNIPFDAIMKELYRQATLVTVKEVYGYAVLAGIAILILSLMTRYGSIIKLKMPRWE